MQPRTRLDTFQSGNKQVRVFARKNHVIATQQFIKQTCATQVYQYRDQKDGYDFGSVLFKPYAIAFSKFFEKLFTSFSL